MQPHVITETLVAAAAALVAGRLLYLGLAKQFPALAGWLIFSCISTSAVAILSPRSVVYFWVYVIALPLECITGIFAVRELFALIFNDYPGIRTIGRWAMYGAVSISLAATLSAIRIFWSDTAKGRAHSGIYYLQMGHRTVLFSLAIVIISLLFSISRYPLHLDRNTYVSCGFFCAVFLAEAAGSLADSLAPKLFNNYTDWATNVGTAIFLLAWATRLQVAREPVPARVTFASPAEDHLLQELASLNQLLSRAARR